MSSARNVPKQLVAGRPVVYLGYVKYGIPKELEIAFAHCSRLTRDHYENFPVASWLMPANLRPHICSIYAFARTADDFADEPGLEQSERLSLLAEWRERLDDCLDTPDDLIFQALGHTIRQFDIPIKLLRDLISAFRQDVLESRHETFEDLIAYSERSANPVGRLILTLFRYTDPKLVVASDAICTALQLTNFWQDIAVDYARDRIYLPQQEMAKFALAETDLGNGEVTPEFRNLMKDLIERTRRLYDQGITLPEKVHGRLRYELRLTWLGGSRILDEIENVDYDIFKRRPTLTRLTGVHLLIKSLRPVGSVE